MLIDNVMISDTQLLERIKKVSQTYAQGGNDFDDPYINKAGLIDYLCNKVLNVQEAERAQLIDTLNQELNDFDKKGYVNDSNGVLKDFTKNIRKELTDLSKP